MFMFDAKCIFLLSIAIGMSFGDDAKLITFITADQERGVGDSVEFECTLGDGVSGIPFWIKKSHDRQGDPIIYAIGEGSAFPADKRFTVSKEGTTYKFGITKIELNDSGTYECQVSLTPTQKESLQVKLLIRRPPIVEKIEIIPSPVPEGNSAQLKCIADGYPRPAIYWSRENDKLLPRGNHSVAKVEYKIDEVTREDRGVYYCTADNGVGKSNRRSINFEVEFAPIISVPRPKVAQALDYDIELDCRVEAFPAPTVVWFKNDKQIDGDSSDYSISNTATVNEVTTSVLRVITAEPGQYGDYVCKARNKIGSAEARINLFEQTYPNINFSGLQWSGSTTIFHHLQYIFNYITIITIAMIFV